MTHSIFKFIHLSLLCALLVLGKGHVFDNPITVDSIQYAQISTVDKSFVADISSLHVPALPAFTALPPENLFWLSLLFETMFDQADAPIPPWPEQSQLHTFSNIIAYQHYTSWLSPTLSID